MNLAKRLLTALVIAISAGTLRAETGTDNGGANSWQGADATVSIIIDDVGNNRRLGDAILALDQRLTLSILPFTPYAQYFSDFGQRAGNEIMLHLPMQSIGGALPSPTQLQVDMDRHSFDDMVDHNMAAFEGFTGVNNHQGSRMMKDAERLDWLMSDLAQRGKFFVDSRTVGRSPAIPIAREYGIPTVGRDVFLDDENTEAAVTRQFNKMIRVAQRHGHAVAIGHPRPATIAVLRREMPRLKALNIAVVPVTTTIALADGQTMVAGLSLDELRGRDPRQAVSAPAPIGGR